MRFLFYVFVGVFFLGISGMFFGIGLAINDASRAEVADAPPIATGPASFVGKR